MVLVESFSLFVHNENISDPIIFIEVCKATPCSQLEVGIEHKAQ